MNSTWPPSNAASAGTTPASSAVVTPAGSSKRTRVVPVRPISSSGRALGDEATGDHHADAVGEVLGLVEVVRREQHGRSARGQVPDQLPRLASGRRVEPRRRLVEEQQFRQCRRCPSPDRGDDADHRTGARSGGWSCGVRPTSSTTSATGAAAPVPGAVDVDGLGDGELVLHPCRLEHDADAIAEVPVGVARVAAEHGHVARRARAVALEDLHRRRLAGAVVAEQGVHLAVADLERDPVDGGRPA